jgi:hypothetical protein
MIRKEQIPNNHEWELSYLRKNCSKICDFDEKSKCAKRQIWAVGQMEKRVVLSFPLLQWE